MTTEQSGDRNGTTSGQDAPASDGGRARHRTVACRNRGGVRGTHARGEVLTTDAIASKPGRVRASRGGCLHTPGRAGVWGRPRPGLQWTSKGATINGSANRRLSPATGWSLRHGGEPVGKATMCRRARSGGGHGTRRTPDIRAQGYSQSLMGLSTLDEDYSAPSRRKQVARVRSGASVTTGVGCAGVTTETHKVTADGTLNGP